MDARDCRYVVLCIDTKAKDHEGRVFADLREARRMANEVISEGYADKAVIGMFVLKTDAMEMYVSHVEAIGFQGDKKNIDQLELFKSAGV